MDNKNYSVLKSRLRLSEPAFVSLMEFGLDQAKGYKTVVSGFNVRIQEARILINQITTQSIDQSFNVLVEIEKPRGWLPLRMNMDLNFNWSWSITDQQGYPAIEIHRIDISSNKNDHVEFLKLNIGVPNLIKDKIFNEIIRKKHQIEEIINRIIRNTCDEKLSKPQVIVLDKSAAPFRPKFKIEKIKWNLKLQPQYIVVDFSMTAQFTLYKLDQPRALILMQRIKLSDQDRKSILRVRMPLETITAMMETLSIPLGNFGHSNIAKANLRVVSADQAMLELKLSDDVKGHVSVEIILNTSSKYKFDIGHLRLELDNKMLDMGASLFETKIDKLIQENINRSVGDKLNELENGINNYLISNRESIIVNEKKFSVDDLNFKYEWSSDGLHITVWNDFLAEMKIRNISDKLLNLF